jgi:hypothetical protein
MNKDLKMFVIVFGCLCLLFLLFLLTSINTSFKKNLSYNFSGTIDSVTYDEKGTPTIIINHQEYILSAGYNFDYKIEVGDTLIKHESSTSYKLIKHKTREVIVFNN